MKRCLSFVRFFACLSIVYGVCGCAKQSKDRDISGTLRGLPDGIMYLRDIDFNKIDSCSTIGGRFQFHITSQKFPEPAYATMFHCATKDSTLRFFQFPTKRKIKGYPVTRDRFMLDQEGIWINGTITESFFATKRVSCKIDGVVKFGKQTNALLADTLNLNGKVKLDDMKRVIVANPFSYHQLYNVKSILHSLSEKQILSLLTCFDKDVLASKTALDMKNYVTSRGQKRLYHTSLIDSAGKQHSVLNANAKLNMVILWASWCGPCIKEIPQLKDVYQKFGANQNFNMVSVSVDRDKLQWENRLRMENMPWNQLLLEGTNADYYKEIFDVNSSIPTILFYGQNGKLLKRYIGYDAKNKDEIFNLVASNLDK